MISVVQGQQECRRINAPVLADDHDVEQDHRHEDDVLHVVTVAG